MRRKDKEITDENIIMQILRNSEICRLGLIDGTEAYIVPVNYAWKEGNIYIHSAPTGRKIDLIRKNNRVTFEIELSHEIVTGDNPCQWSAKYRSVMGRGTVELFSDRDSKKEGLDLIMTKYGATGELIYDEVSLSKMIVLKIKIESISAKQSGEWRNN